MRRHRKAKILATLGPSSSDEATIRALHEAGADVFRLNFSPGTHTEHKARRIALQEGFAKPRDKLVITAGVPFGTPGTTNLLRIAWIEGAALDS